MRHKSVIAAIIASFLLLGGCTGHVELQEYESKPQTAPASFIGLGSPVSLPLQKNYVDAMVGFSAEGEPSVLTTSPVVYSNTLKRVDNGFAFATLTGVEVFNASGSLENRYEANVGDILTEASNSPNYSYASFAYNTGDAEKPEKHAILTVSNGDQQLVESESFPMGLTTCNDGRVLWVDVDGILPVLSTDHTSDQRRVVLARMNPDGTVDRSLLSRDIPLAGGDAAIDCDSENASFTVFDEQGNVQLVTVKNAFSSDISTNWVKLDPSPPSSALPRNSGLFNGAYFSLLEDGSISIRRGFEKPVLSREKLDLGGDQPLSVTFDGAFMSVVHYPQEDSETTRVTVFSLEDLSCHSTAQPLHFWDSEEVENLSVRTDPNLYLSAVLPVEELIQC